MKFHVEVEGPCRGYMCEVYKGHFMLPDLGPIGANCLANPRDFKTPVARYEDRDCEFRILNKFQGRFFESTMDHSIYDVVAWYDIFYIHDIR